MIAIINKLSISYYYCQVLEFVSDKTKYKWKKIKLFIWEHNTTSKKIRAEFTQASSLTMNTFSHINRKICTAVDLLHYQNFVSVDNSVTNIYLEGR